MRIFITFFWLSIFFSHTAHTAAVKEKNSHSETQRQDQQPQPGIVYELVSQKERDELFKTGQLKIYSPKDPLVPMDHIATLNDMIEDLPRYQRLHFHRAGLNFDQTYVGKAAYIVYDLTWDADGVHNFKEMFFSRDPIYQDPLYAENVLPDEYLDRWEFNELRQKIVSLLPRPPENMAYLIEYFFICNHNHQQGFLSFHQDNVNILFTMITHAAGLERSGGFMGLGLGPRGKRPIRPMGNPNNRVDEEAPIRFIEILKPEAGAGYQIYEIPNCKCQEVSYPFIAHCQFEWGNNRRERDVPENKKPQEVTRNLFLAKVKYVPMSRDGNVVTFYGSNPIYPMEHCANCSKTP